jgi:hypothetical protein
MTTSPRRFTPVTSSLRRQARWPLVVVVAVAAQMVGCGKSEVTPTGPSTVVGPLTGVWTGTLTRPGSTQSVRVELTEVFVFGFIANGTYVVTDSSGTTSGTAGGVASGASVSLILTPSTPPPCSIVQPFLPGQVGMVLSLDGNRMTGDATFMLCGSAVRGTATLTR